MVVNEGTDNVSVLLSSRWFTGQTYTTAQPSQLAFAQPPTDTIASSVINGSTGVQVAVEDSAGSTVSDDSSPVTLTLSGGTFASGGSTVTVNAVNGVATFGNLVINTLGSYTLTAGDGTLTNATSNSFTITVPGMAAKLGFTQQPTGAQAGVAISPAVTVAVQDASGNTITTDASSVTLTLGSGTFASGGSTVTAAAVNGVATFSGLVIDAVAGYTLTAGDGSLTDAISGSFTISPAAAAKLAFTQQPTNTVGGSAISPAVTVAVEDTFGNTVTPTPPA